VTTLREATITIPIMPRGTVTELHIRSVLQTAKEWMTRDFEGVTITMGHRAWGNPDTGEVVQEPVAVYTTAIDPTKGYGAPFRKVVELVGRVLKQERVYVKYPDGKAEIVPTARLWQDMPAPTAADA
jgi:hypothetical protein